MVLLCSKHESLIRVHEYSRARRYLILVFQFSILGSWFSPIKTPQPSGGENWVSRIESRLSTCFWAVLYTCCQAKKEELQLNVFRGSLLRWFLGVVYGVEVVTEGGSGFSLHLHFTLTLLLAVSRMYSNVVNGYITCKAWSPYTFQDNLNRYSAQI